MNKTKNTISKNIFFAFFIDVFKQKQKLLVEASRLPNIVNLALDGSNIIELQN